jgi:hypothetical protein
MINVTDRQVRHGADDLLDGRERLRRRHEAERSAVSTVSGSIGARIMRVPVAS